MSFAKKHRSGYPHIFERRVAPLPLPESRDRTSHQNPTHLFRTDYRHPLILKTIPGKTFYIRTRTGEGWSHSKEHDFKRSHKCRDLTFLGNFDFTMVGFGTVTMSTDGR